MPGLRYLQLGDHHPRSDRGGVLSLPKDRPGVVTLLELSDQSSKGPSEHHQGAPVPYSADFGSASGAGTVLGQNSAWRRLAITLQSSIM